MGPSPIRSTAPVALLCGALLTSSFSGCASKKPMAAAPQRPMVAPASATEEAEPLALDSSQIAPMYTEVVAIDLPTITRVATAKNFDILQARLAVEAAQGLYESAVGGIFPVIAPVALFEHVEGTVRATEGNLVRVGFNTFQPSIAVQWVVNPGRVIYEIAASKKRLAATVDQQDAVVLETLRRAATQFYEQVLAQARVSAAHQGVAEAEELLRISRLRLRTGTGVRADELRAEARLAQRRQDLESAINDFYAASVALAVTLRMDSSVTLVPSIEALPPIRLVRDDLAINDMLEIAATFRPDLESVRALVEAATADTGATWWGGFGPTFEARYQYGGITGHANNVVEPTSTLATVRALQGRDDQTFSFSDQQRVTASMGWRLTLSAFGKLKAAKAFEEQAALEAEKRLAIVRAEVVRTAQDSKTNHVLIGLARQQVAAAEEALRLGEANLRAGTMTTLDVLQAQDAATQARLRYAEAVVRFNQSQVNLLAALGLLDEATLLGAASTEDSAGS